MKNIEVDIVIPVYEGYKQVICLFNSFKMQKNITIKNIVIPLTIGDNDIENNKIRKFITENNIISFEILKNDFSHSLVREKAIFKYCKSDIVVLLTQDVKLFSVFSIYKLVRDIDDRDIVFTFGRQICNKKNNIEKYIRDFNYPKESYVVKKENMKDYQIKTFFASDAFAGLNRQIFIKLGGYKGIDVSTNEDMLYMHSLLTNNYKAKYCHDALVEHFHLHSIKSLYNRYYNYGLFFKKVHIFDKYNKTGSGKRLAFYVLKKSFMNFDIISLFRWLPNMAVRFFGMIRGKHSN